MSIPRDLTKRVKLTPDKLPPKPLLKLDELGLDEPSKSSLIDKLELCIYYRAQKAEADIVLEDDKKTNRQGVKAGVVQLMRRACVKEFNWDGLKVGYITSTRSTVSREKLILAGVDAALVDRCTNESAPFDTLSIDTLTQPG